LFCALLSLAAACANAAQIAETRWSLEPVAGYPSQT
jgi:hypothetical protein